MNIDEANKIAADLIRYHLPYYNTDRLRPSSIEAIATALVAAEEAGKRHGRLEAAGWWGEPNMTAACADDKGGVKLAPKPGYALMCDGNPRKILVNHIGPEMHSVDLDPGEQLLVLAPPARDGDAR